MYSCHKPSTCKKAVSLKHDWRRKWQPAPVFLSGKSHRRRSLVGCSPWGRTESDTTELLSLFTFMHRRKWQPTPVFLPGESQGWGSLMGCCQTRLKRLSSSTKHDKMGHALCNKSVNIISLEKEMASHSSFLALKIQCTKRKRKSHAQKSLVGYSLWSCKRIGHNLVTKQQLIHMFPPIPLLHIYSREMKTCTENCTQIFIPVLFIVAKISTTQIFISR